MLPQRISVKSAKSLLFFFCFLFVQKPNDSKTLEIKLNPYPYTKLGNFRIVKVSKPFYKLNTE